MGEAFVYNFMGRGNDGAPDRVLNAPTNEAWIDPWTRELRRLGARLRLGHTLERLVMRNGRIAAAHVRSARGRRNVIADYYVCALPVERARRLWTPAILRADPALAGMQRLGTDWMNGVSFYLRTRPDIVKGHFGLLSSPWAITGLPQAQFWARDLPADYGDGTVREKVSVSIADFGAPGMFNRKRGRDCTADELAAEVWAQLKHYLARDGKDVLTDDMLHSWQVDPGLVRPDGRLSSQDPLVLPTVATEQYRPGPATAIFEHGPCRRLPQRRVGGRQHGSRVLRGSPCRRGRARSRRLAVAAGPPDRAVPPAGVGAAQAHRRGPLSPRPAQPVRR
jgi:hypothetical protein